MAPTLSIQGKVCAVFLLAIVSIAPASAQLSQEPVFSSPAQKENWVEWNILQTLRDTLSPAYIPPQTEAQVQHWLGEVHKFNSEFNQANDHVEKMDHATRAHDVKTANAEAQAAADILNHIPWKPYSESDVFNDTQTSTGDDSVPQDGIVPPPPPGGATGAPPPPPGGSKLPSLVLKGSTVSNAHFTRVQNVIKGLPPNIQQFMGNHHVKVIATDTVVNERPGEKGVHPRGWLTGLTWDNSDGTYDKNSNEVIVADRYTLGGKLVHSDRVAAVAHHESGHAVDHNMGDFSHKNPQFLNTYSKEKGELLSAAKSHDPAATAATTGLSYILQYGDPGKEEMFSESFAILNGGAASGSAAQQMIERYFPNTIKVVKDAMTSLR